MSTLSRQTSWILTELVTFDDLRVSNVQWNWFHGWKFFLLLPVDKKRTAAGAVIFIIASDNVTRKTCMKMITDYMYT